MDDETYTSIAKADFFIKLVCGFVFSIIGFIGCTIGMIAALVYSRQEIVGIMVILMLAFIVLGVVDGIFLFRKPKKKAKEQEKENK